MNPIHFKEIESREANHLFELINNNKERLKRYFPITSKGNKTISSTIKYIEDLNQKTKKKETIAFGIYNSQELIGMVFIKNIDKRVSKCELGYFLDKDFEGKGIMSEIVSKIVNHCFGVLKLNKVFLRIGTENIGSKQVALKNGFLLEGVLRKEFKIETKELVDVEYYGKINPIKRN